MRNIAICGSRNIISTLGKNFIEPVMMNSMPLFCGLLHTPKIDFYQNYPENNSLVFVKKRAFSCNYRDKNIIFNIALNADKKSFFVIGSDFVGEVIDVGSGVTELKIGDKVIANNAYGELQDNLDARPGLPTNHGSKEYQVFHQSKLIKVPPEMPDEVAAAFSIGGQTSYSMIRKINPQPGLNILVTAAKSNTSLFAISALHKYNVNIYVTTTSILFAEELKEMGVKEVILIESKPDGLISNKSIQQIVTQKGGFDAVIDPFFDLHLQQVVELMAENGKYITCGLYDQYFHLIHQEFNPHFSDFNRFMTLVLAKNLQIIGNCLGNTQDLQNAIDDYASGNLEVVIDSVFTNTEIRDFFERTYNAKDRFGKVVYKYQ